MLFRINEWPLGRPEAQTTLRKLLNLYSQSCVMISLLKTWSGQRGGARVVCSRLQLPHWMLPQQRGGADERQGAREGEQREEGGQGQCSS